MSFSIVRALQDKEVLLTGATGFLGLALVEKLLRHVPGCRLVLLVRGADQAAAEQRLHALLASEPLFANLDAHTLARVQCVVGDITAARLGMQEDARAALRGRIALVIHAAASVDFDEPIDEAIRVNIEGPLAVQALASEIGADLLQISTAYVCGERHGPVPDVLDSAGTFANRLPLQAPDVELRQLQAEVVRLHAVHGRAMETSGKPSKRLTLDLMTAGRDYANARGWTDIYTFTKYLAE